MPKHKKKQLMIQVDPEALAGLDALASDYPSLSTNAILATAAAELAKVPRKPGALWHALARISRDSEAPPPAPEGQPDRRIRKAHTRTPIDSNVAA